MTVHRKKVATEYWDALVTRQKTFEVRFNDCNYQVGDWLYLYRWPIEDAVPDIRCRITYVLDHTAGYGLIDDWVVLGLEFVD